MAAALRTCLIRMGLPQDAAVYAMDVMGLNSLVLWRDFHDDEDLVGLSKNLRSPGGTRLNAAGAEERHPGFPVSVKAISNLKIMRIALKHHQHIQRAVTAPTITHAWLAEWEFLVDFYKETSKKKPSDEDLPKITMNDWAKTKEKIVTHFTEVYGKEGIPLAYVLRETAAVPAVAEDPPANYDGDHVKELIARAAQTGATYRADNRTMCRMLKKICEDTPAYTYVSKYTADGRQAWTALMGVYLGPQHTQNQAAIYEAKLQNSTYEGESSRFGYDKYSEIHKLGHTRLEALVTHGYKGIDEGTKIRYFINGIKNDKLKTVIELVRGNPDYATFDSVARRIKDSVILLKPSRASTTRQVSSVVVTNAKGEELFPGIEADMNVEDKFYPIKEWNKLSAAKKKGVLHKRSQRGQSPKGGKQQQNGGGKRSFKKMQKKMAALQKKISALSVADGGDDPSASESEEDEPPKKKKKLSQREHPDLNRNRGSRR